MSFRPIRAAIFFILLSGTSLPAADAPTAGKTGTFDVSFTQRSPLTTPKERAARLVEKPAPTDYDLSQSEFLVVVPDSYDPAKPMGLIVLDNYKDTTEPPMTVLDSLAEKNMAFISLKSNGTPWDQKCGVNVDAVYNMEQLYKIDPTRVYLFGFDYDCCGARLMGGYPDVFSETFLCEFVDFWKTIVLPDKRQITAKVGMPPSRQLGQAKMNPVMLAAYKPERTVAAASTYRSVGFKSVMTVLTSNDDVHYPHYTKPWLETTLDFLDAKRVQPKAPVTRPATRPATRPVR